MAGPTAWTVYNKAKKKIGNGTITLGAGVFKMQLHRSASNASTATISLVASITNEISATGGYATGGRNIGPTTGKWDTGASVGQYKFYYTTLGLVFTASSANLTNVKFAVIRNSVGAGTGHVLCWSRLSTSQFSITAGNTLTVTPAATGVFTLA